MRLALYQNESVPGDTARQLTALTRVARELTGKAEMLVTPELFMSGYRLPAADLKRLAEPADGSFARAVANLARETGIAITYAFPERDGDLVFNSLQVFGPDGMSLIRGFKIAPLICYDIEFPECARACAEAGADLIIAPTALRQHWSQIAEMMMPIRALENGAYLAYCNFAGVEGDWHYAGLSSISGPDGQVLAKAGAKEEVIVATLDIAEVAKARERLSYLKDRRFKLMGPN